MSRTTKPNRTSDVSANVGESDQRGKRHAPKLVRWGAMVASGPFVSLVGSNETHKLEGLRAFECTGFAKLDMGFCQQRMDKNLRCGCGPTGRKVLGKPPPLERLMGEGWCGGNGHSKWFRGFTGVGVQRLNSPGTRSTVARALRRVRNRLEMIASE